MTGVLADRLSGGTGKACIPWLVSGFGVLSFVLFLVWAAVLLTRSDVAALVLGIGLVGAPAIGLTVAGVRLERSGVPAERYVRIAAWCFGGGLGFLAINLPAMILFPWYELSGTVSWAHFSINVGAVGGFAVGYVEARAIQREVEATAATVRAEQLEAERELLTYLNDLLRHEVLNAAQVIEGNATLLLNDCSDEQTRAHLEKIKHRSNDLSDVIDDVRAMLNANKNHDATGVVDLSELLRGEVSALRARFDEVDVDTTIPDGVTVVGNEGLELLFSNLLENAVEHNDNATPRVTVTVETAPETVTVKIADNGPGIAESTRETLFERKSSNHGLGLYLARILATRYGGSVDLAETGPDGTTFTVMLVRPSTRDPGPVKDTTDEATTETPALETRSLLEFRPHRRNGGSIASAVVRPFDHDPSERSFHSPIPDGSRWTCASPTSSRLRRRSTSSDSTSWAFRNAMSPSTSTWTSTSRTGPS